MKQYFSVWTTMKTQPDVSGKRRIWRPFLGGAPPGRAISRELIFVPRSPRVDTGHEDWVMKQSHGVNKFSLRSFITASDCINYVWKYCFKLYFSLSTFTFTLKTASLEQ